MILKTIAMFLLRNLGIIHKGTFIQKGIASASLAASASPMVYIIEKIMSWTVTNETYVLFVFGAIIIDHALGTIIHAFIEKDFSVKKNLIGLITKAGLAVAMGLLFEGVNHIVQEDSFVKSYTIIVLRLTVFLYPAGSAFMNSAVITNGKFPPIGLINKVKKFNENLDVNQFKKE